MGRVGVRDAWANGVQVLRDGKHTGARPGHAVRGPVTGRIPELGNHDAAETSRAQRGLEATAVTDQHPHPAR